MKKIYGVMNKKNDKMVTDTNLEVRTFTTKEAAQKLVDKMLEAHPTAKYEIVDYTAPETELAPEEPKKKAPTKKSAEAEKAPEKAKKASNTVMLMTFTGMEIGEYKVIKKTSATVTIETKKGELKFSLKTMTQTNANNPKFANKIEFVK